MNNNKPFYVPYNSLYSFIAQRNHVEWERYKPANEYHNAIRSLKPHFDEMNRTFRDVKKEVKANNLKAHFEFNDKYNFGFKKKSNELKKQNNHYYMSDIEKEEESFKEIKIKFNEINDYFKKYEKQISHRISFR